MRVLTDDELVILSNYTKSNYGIDLQQKKSMVESRLYSYLASRGFKTFSNYYQTLINDQTGTEAAALMNRLSTNYTFFMREQSHLEFLRGTILPYFQRTIKNNDLRIWSAGCSSGEEPYTLAMVLDDYFGSVKSVWDTKILATDISLKVLEFAFEAVYSDDQLKCLPDRWKKCYLEPYSNGKQRVTKSIRNEIIFKKFNLISNQFPFKNKFHVIFCRNVMIYFDEPTKRELVDRMYDHTCQGGYLIIGLSESLDHKETRYRRIRPSIYRKE